MEKKKLETDINVLISKSKTMVDASMKSKTSKQIKKDVFSKYEIYDSDELKNQYKSILFIMKKYADRKNDDAKNLREILYRNPNVKIGFWDGLKDLWKNRKDEASNLSLIGLVFLTYAPFIAMKTSHLIFLSKWGLNTGSLTLFVLGFLFLGVITPLYFIYKMFYQRVIKDNLEKEVLKYISSNFSEYQLNNGINMVDFIYQIERSVDKEKNAKLLTEIVKLEEEKWKTRGIPDKILIDMAIKYKYSVDEFLDEKNMKQIFEQILKIKKIKSEI